MHDRAVYKEQTEQLTQMRAGELESITFQSSYMHSQGLMVAVDGELTLVRDDDGEPVVAAALGQRALTARGASDGPARHNDLAVRAASKLDRS